MRGRRSGARLPAAGPARLPRGTVPRVSQDLGALIVGGRASAEPELERREIGIVGGPQFHRGAIGALRRGVRPQAERAIASRAEREPRRALEVGRGDARGARELEGGQVVVRERLGPVLQTFAPERLDPGSGGPMLVGACRARICPYATSRTKRWRNAYSDSPPTDERRERRTKRPRSSSWSRRSRSAGSRLPISATAPTQKVFPTTAASWSTVLSSGRARRSGRR